MLLRGIVTKKTESGEHNKLITLYTRELGKIRVLAKSAKKSTSKQAGHLDLFNVVDFVAVPGKSYPIMTQAQSTENFLGIKSSFSKLMAGFFILESFHKLVYENEQDEALWNFLMAQVNKLDRSTELSTDDFLNGFKKELLGVLGYNQDFDKKEIDYFLQSLSNQKFYSCLILPGF